MNAKALVSAILIGSVATAVAVAFADSSIVVLALPELFSEFDTTIPGVSFVVTSYNIVVAIGAFLVLPIARRVSPRLLAQTGLVVFLVASIGAAAADGLTILVAWRAVQGLGAALLLVASLSLLAGLTGSAKRGTAIWTTAGTLGAALGPALGGVLTEAFDWRAIFIVQAPVAGLALLATLGSHATIPAEAPVATRSPPAPAGNIAIAFLFGALVGALFLAVLLLVAVWGLSPLEGAAVVSALPAATLAVRLFASALPSRVSTAGGSLLLALGLAGLALLPSTSVAFAAVALALCGAGLGLALPVLSHATVSPEHGLIRSGAWSIGARHVGLVAALVLVAPLLAWELERGGEQATLAGTAAIMDAPVPLSAKVPLALDLKDEFERTPQGKVPDLTGPFAERSEDGDPSVGELERSLIGSIEDVLTRSFRSSFALAGLFALIAIVPAMLVRPRPEEPPAPVPHPGGGSPQSLSSSDPGPAPVSVSQSAQPPARLDTKRSLGPQAQRPGDEWPRSGPAECPGGGRAPA